jgi:transposase InsO family protein
VLNGIKIGIITVKNPQTNAIRERLHQSISNSLRVMLKAHPPIKEFQAQNIVDTSLLHHMQLELLFIVHCVFHQEHGFSNMI